MKVHPVAAPTLFASALIVEPDPATRELYCTILETHVNQVVYSGDGRDALARAIGNPPSIVITETRLPYIDGFTLCTLLRHDERTAAVPIAIVTSDTLPENIARAESCADAVLVKSCLPATLLDAIDRLARKSQRLQEQSIGTWNLSAQQRARSAALLDKVGQLKRTSQTRALHRYVTTTPPSAPPLIVCPSCDQPLRYLRSHIGGVNEHQVEQWDYYECLRGCGTFQYRERTHKLRRA